MLELNHQHALWSDLGRGYYFSLVLTGVSTPLQQELVENWTMGLLHGIDVVIAPVHAYKGQLDTYLGPRVMLLATDTPQIVETAMALWDEDTGGPMAYLGNTLIAARSV